MVEHDTGVKDVRRNPRASSGVVSVGKVNRRVRERVRELLATGDAGKAP